MRIGIDLGGSKISALAFDKDDIAYKKIRRTAPRGCYRDTLFAIRDLVYEIEYSNNECACIGLGMPGAISPATGLIKNTNSAWLIGQPLDRDLQAMLNRPLRVANDADCFALSEATDGAASNESPVFGAILGTGVGGGLVVKGRLLKGANAIAGEWGHTPLPRPTAEERPGPRCYCGRHGCVETFLSGPGLAADYVNNGGDPAATAQDVIALARCGDTCARAAFELYLDRLGRSLANIVNIVDPAVIVLGGGLSNATELYDMLPDRMDPHVFSDQVATRIHPPRHGDDSGVRGAARLWSPEETAAALKAGSGE